MKMFKNTLAMFLSTVMLAGLIAVPATQAVAAGETVTRTINLLDLSETAAGTTLSKENLTNWPEGMTVGDFDDYDGTRSVVELEDGTKALKLAFDKKQATAPSNRQLDGIANYDFKFSIPAAYRPYINSVKLSMENRSNLFQGWEEKELLAPYFLLAFTNGTDYSKISDKTLEIKTTELEYTLPVAGVAKVSAWNYQDWADINSATKWTEEERSGMTDVVLSVTVPYIDDITTYMLIKSLELEITGTKEELDAAEKAANAITRTINLLDLSETAAGTTLSKENLTNWPEGMTVGDFDDYDGTRSVVELEDGTKALKLAFDKKQATAPSNRQLDGIANYDFKFSIPAAYRPYINSVKLSMENRSNLFQGWGEKELLAPYFLLAFTNGTYYSKISEKTLEIKTAELEYTLPVAGVARVDGYGYCNWAATNGTKWTEEEKSGMTDVVLSVTAPYIDDLTTFVLIKSLELEITGTKEELDAAEKEALSELPLINNFESGAGSHVVNAKDKGVFAASGDFVLEHTRTSGNPWENDISVSLDSRVRFYDGISFYLYNPNEAKELKCYLLSASGAVAQKNFTASKAGDYIKYTVWFDDVGTTNGNWDSGTTNTGVSLTPEQIASLSSIQFRVPYGGAGVSYYFDDFRYEKHNSEPVKEKKLDLTTAIITADNGYTDTETPTVSADGITYSVDGTRGDQAWQGWKTVIDVSDGSMINANGLNITATYKSTGTNKLKIGATLYGIDENGKEQWWNWGENPDSINVSAGEKVTSTLKYTEGLYETGEWGIHNWGNKIGYPTGSESAMLKQIQLYVWAPADTVADDTVTISDVSVLYGGGKVSLADGVQHGTISIGDNGYTYQGSSAVSNTGYFFAGEKAVINIIPDSGYALVPGSLKLIDSTGKEIEITREGFRKLNSASYSFTMPVADVTVSAEFVPEEEVLGKAFNNITADVANNQLKFDYTVPLKNGKIKVDGAEYKAVGYGMLVTTVEVLDKYSFWDGFTVEDIENGNYIAELSTNVHINESDGYFYDKSVSLARFNAVVNVPDSMKDTEFAVRPYVEYEKDGKTERLYGYNESYSFASQAFGMYEFAAEPSYAKGVNMAGMFDNTNADAAAVRNSIYVAPETYEAVAYEGFDHVRLPVTFASHLDADGTINADYLEAVDKAVIAALSNDLTVVIDLHHYSDLKTNFEANKANFYSIWEQLAEHYKNYPNRVIFELLNEPSTVTGAVSAMTAASLNEIQLAAVDKIRAIDSDRIIALAVFDNNSALNLNNLTLPADTSNLIVSVHNYDHYAFTHQGIGGSEDTARHDYTASGSKDLILNRLQIANEFSKTYNIPVWISEFGVYLGGLTTDGVFTTEDVTAYYKDFTTTCNGYGIGWCVWEYNVGFGVFNPDNTLKDFVKAGLFPNG